MSCSDIEEVRDILKASCADTRFLELLVRSAELFTSDRWRKWVKQEREIQEPIERES